MMACTDMPVAFAHDPASSLRPIIIAALKLLAVLKFDVRRKSEKAVRRLLTTSKELTAAGARPASSDEDPRLPVESGAVSCVVIAIVMFGK